MAACGTPVRLLDAESVPPGAIVAVEANGTELVIWRSAAGKVSVTGARCPHQWSHLAEAGLIAGEELICTTHWWQFDQCGRGWKESATGRRDRKSDLPVLVCEERDGAIWLLP